MKLKFFIAALILFFTIPFLYIFRSNNPAIRKWWCRVSLWLLGVKLELVGELDPKTELFVLNHQSLLDIMALEILTPANLCWVAKKELFNLFYFGHLLKAPKMICVDREDKKGLFALLADAKARRFDNRQLAIFPEGTRSKTKELLPFKPGAKLLGEKLHLRIQPIIVVDSARFIDSKSSGGVLKVIALESFEPKDDWFNEVRIKMQNVLITERAIS